jgi:hypothetical protein
LDKRLVHQHQRRLDHDGAGDGDALLLAAGKLAGQLVDLALQPDQRGRLGDALVDLGLGQAAHLQAEADILVHAHMREQRIVLEHHAEAALFRAAAGRCACRRARCRRRSRAAGPRSG